MEKNQIKYLNVPLTEEEKKYVEGLKCTYEKMLGFSIRYPDYLLNALTDANKFHKLEIPSRTNIEN